MKKTIIAFAASAVLAVSSLTALASNEINLTTGAVGGTYHDVLGVNLRNVLRERSVNVNIMESTGSGEN